jgi:predicted anti-sigma-YlaC factor YlaD
VTETTQRWGLFQAVILMLTVSTVVSVARVAMGDTSLLQEPFGQTEICFGLGLLAYAYYKLQSTDWRIFFGVIQILAATLSNLHQLGEMGDLFSKGTAASATSTGIDFVDRLVFIGGAIAVLAHGIKDIGEGVKTRKSRLSAIAPPSSVSPGAPGPGSQAPE